MRSFRTSRRCSNREIARLSTVSQAAKSMDWAREIHLCLETPAAEATVSESERPLAAWSRPEIVWPPKTPAVEL